MGINTDPASPNDQDTPIELGKTVLEAVTYYKINEKKRWNRRIISLIFVGLLISLLVHINIAVLLRLLNRPGNGTIPSGAYTTIDFAIEDTESLTSLPEGKAIEMFETVQTQVSAESLQPTQATLAADDPNDALEATSHTMAPSLAGGGSSGMGMGLGGSGGAGTSFFGISSSGSRFCYIVDASGSMQQDERLASAVEELTQSLKKLPDFARFYVLFYSSDVLDKPMQNGWNTARGSTVRRIVKDLQQIRPSGGTKPKSAFEKAFELQPLPDVIYFLTDGEISGFSVKNLQALIPEKHRVVVNTIAFGNNASQKLLREIAQVTGGQFTFVSTRGAP